MPRFELKEKDKFAILAIENVFADLPENCQEQLSDRTRVLDRIPVDIEAHWKEWLGSIRWDEIRKSNVVLIRASASTNPQILDAEHEKLGKHLTQTFYMLQLSGVLEYDGADLLKGSLVNGGAQIRQSSRLPDFKQTMGYTRTAVTLDRLEEAGKRGSALDQIHAHPGDFTRLMRGLNVLMDGLRQQIPQERIHQFVRSLEALILPETGKTKKQFAHRCQTFAKASAVTKQILDEAFDMRSEAEHLNGWENSLQSYEPADRENIAFQRTRQKERLACVAFSRILDDQAVRNHFKNESTLDDFWKKIDDPARKLIWGVQLDLTSIMLAQEYDGQGRAAY